MKEITLLYVINHLNLDGIKVWKIMYLDLFQGLGKCTPIRYLWQSDFYLQEG